jgi:hypothetical protein
VFAVSNIEQASRPEQTNIKPELCAFAGVV